MHIVTCMDYGNAKNRFMCLSDDSFETKLWEAIPREKLVLIGKCVKMLQIYQKTPYRFSIIDNLYGGLFVKQYSISKLLLQFLLQVQVLPTVAPL